MQIVTHAVLGGWPESRVLKSAPSSEFDVTLVSLTRRFQCRAMTRYSAGSLSGSSYHLPGLYPRPSCEMTAV